MTFFLLVLLLVVVIIYIFWILLKPGEKYTPKKGLQKKEEPRQDQGPDAQEATRNDRD